jgi:DNA-binding NtrC family response regulator
MITAYATPKLAVEAIKAGAIDYLAKPFAPEELLHAVSRCAERHRLLRENAALRAHATEVYQLEQIIGESPKMVELRSLIQSVAPTNATVLILGESGTGKELVAGALHSLSRRSQKNYIRINCAAIPENLLESELFGHEKGAFTGAIRQKLGRVEEADGGTIFLDEIGDMSRSLQAKLLRFLEDGSFTRVGGNDELKVDVRLIAATNRDIIEAIRQNNFREDLFHRLNVVQFRPPPLRERGSDIVLLAENFLRHYNGFMNKHIRSIAPASRQKLLGHHWPGNVRELRNVVERAVILESTQEIQPSSLPDFHLEGRLRKTEVSPVTGAHSLDELMADFERQLINGTLEQNRYNISKTSEQLKISRHALRYRMQRLNINLDATEDNPPPAANDPAAS